MKICMNNCCINQLTIINSTDEAFVGSPATLAVNIGNQNLFLIFNNNIATLLPNVTSPWVFRANESSTPLLNQTTSLYLAIINNMGMGTVSPDQNFIFEDAGINLNYYIRTASSSLYLRATFTMGEYRITTTPCRQNASVFIANPNFVPPPPL